MLRPIGAGRALSRMQGIEEEEGIQPAKDIDTPTKRGGQGGAWNDE